MRLICVRLGRPLHTIRFTQLFNDTERLLVVSLDVRNMNTIYRQFKDVKQQTCDIVYSTKWYYLQALCLIVLFLFSGLTKRHNKTMMFLVLLMVTCFAKAHRTESEHHVIPYKGKYYAKKNILLLLSYYGLGINVWMFFRQTN